MITSRSFCVALFAAERLDGVRAGGATLISDRLGSVEADMSLRRLGFAGGGGDAGLVSTSSRFELGADSCPRFPGERLDASAA